MRTLSKCQASWAYAFKDVYGTAHLTRTAKQGCTALLMGMWTSGFTTHWQCAGSYGYDIIGAAELITRHNWPVKV